MAILREEIIIDFQPYFKSNVTYPIAACICWAPLWQWPRKPQSHNRLCPEDCWKESDQTQGFWWLGIRGRGRTWPWWMQDIWSTSIAWRHCSACSSTGQYRPTEFKGKSSCTNEEEEREEYFNENWRAIDGKIPLEGHRYSQGQEKGTGPPILVQEEESQSKLGTSLRQDTMGHRTGLHPANIQEVLEVSYPTLRI